MKPYLDLLQHILDHGSERADRTGVGTLSCFGLQTRYAMADGFPALTARRLPWKTMVSELLWFISGSNNLNDLKAIYPHNRIWDANYQDYRQRLLAPSADGSLGFCYGKTWRAYPTPDGGTVDQLQNAIELIRHNPTSRRILVNAWHPGLVGPQDVALPPCHTMFQFYVAGEQLSLQLSQRSCDVYLGGGLNIASFSLLLHMVAHITGLQAHEFIHSIGDAHIYTTALAQSRELLQRPPRPLPTLSLRRRGLDNIDDFVMNDCKLLNYDPHPALTAPMAV